MSYKVILLSLALTAGLIVTTTPAFAGPHHKPPHHHGMHPPIGVSGFYGTPQHLYVLAGRKIMQYSLPDMKLVKSLDLPHPAPPPAAPGPKEGHRVPPPPPPGRAQGIYGANHALYVLAGPMLYQYSTPDLTLKNKVALPKPALPKPAPPKAHPVTGL